ncbi:hypothetical protein [Streptomyces boluensis]|uniref:Uncharacterized protein n=1 Tax=Streptomyces boluensis TaxID=1775135 RepID=A0A964XK89_9ACTN|nr:hypothetical protein [Streptomyces boluensis]NBE51970.1 hypothetical protein [Streptomyces boluensis]
MKCAKEQYVKSAVPLPLAKHAFDDPATQQLWSKSFRVTLTNLLIRAAIWLACLGTAIVGPDRDGAQLVTGVASFLSMITAFLLLGPARKLQWLLAVSRVLKSGPWRTCTAVRVPDAKVPVGIPVQVQVGSEEDAEGAEDAGDGAVSKGQRLLAARTWRRRVPWSDELGRQAWVVHDDPSLPGVLARPGGFDFVTLHRVR